MANQLGVTWSPGTILIAIAVVLFVLAAFGVTLGGIALVPLGLAFFAAGHILG